MNTYFKEKRRIATGITWTATGLGPIIFPILIAYLIPEFGVQGTVLIFGGIALNAVACSLVFQPVKWHVKNNNRDVEIPTIPDKQCAYCLMSAKKNQSIFSSQYLYNSDHHSMAGYEIIDPGTPMLSSANDGWFSRKPSYSGSIVSLASNRTTRNTSRIPSSQNLLISNKTSYVNLGALSKDGKNAKDGYEKVPTDDKVNAVDVSMQDTPQLRKKSISKSEKREKLKEIFNAIKIDEAPAEDCPSYKAPQDLTNNNFNLLQNKPFINDDTLFVNKLPDNVTLRDATPIADKDDVSIGNGTLSRQVSQIEKKQSIFDDLKYLNDNQSGLSTKNQLTPFRKTSTNSFNTEREVLKDVSKKLEQYVSDRKNACTCSEEKKFLEKIDQPSNGTAIVDEKRENYTFIQKVCVFFDLDLLKDISYVNLMVGVTIANFAELNYSILTPFVLAEYGFTKQQIALCMSLLGAMDISTRFLVPFIAGKIGWENKTFFLFGILGMGLGRLCEYCSLIFFSFKF